MDTILGIDLGTTNSVASIIEDNKPRVLKIDGQPIVPSVVGLDSGGKLLVGYPALNQYALAPERTVRSIKRKMGSDETITLGQQSYRPQEISAIVLRWIKERAAEQLGHEITKAVITVPAFFTEQQRQATRQAGEIAGLEVLRIINEPTAASLTYSSGSSDLERLLVYDLGGGTFDVSIVQIEQNVVEVLSSHGNTELGGDDFDQLLLDFVCDKFAEQHDFDLRESLSTKARVLRAVEEAKKQLSFDAFVNLEQEFVAEKDGVPLHLNMELARTDYELLIEPLLSKTLVCVDEALSDAKLSADQIDRVILVGGASRTPLVHEILANQLQKTLHAEVDPDLCVSMGAAMQGGLIEGLELGPVLVDITPHSLGVGALGTLYGFESPYLFARLIERNTPLPCSRSEVFVTHYDNQTGVTVEVFQGEYDDIRQNKYVGGFSLDGLSQVPAGNQILVRFNLDLDGILHVTAIEKATDLNAQVTIENAIGEIDESKESISKVSSMFDSLDPSEMVGAAPGRSNRSAVPDSKQDIAPATVDSVPTELQPLVERARQLTEQAQAVRGIASPDDQQEFDRLIDELQSAIASHSRAKLESVMDALEDLVYYIQDA